MGAMGAALGTMVANLSSHKRGWDDRWEEFASWAERGAKLQKRLLELVDEDTDAYNSILDAFGMPKSNEEEKAARSAAVEAATLNASLVPLEVMKEAYRVFELLDEMTIRGNPNSITDGAVGVLAVRACIRGAYLNVIINVKNLKDRVKAAKLIVEAREIDEAAAATHDEIIERVTKQLAIQ
jgi:glutamate formiminotransferase/formiminotetrahydrofolate cyclodeaminase